MKLPWSLEKENPVHITTVASTANSFCRIMTVRPYAFVCRRLQAIWGEGLHSWLSGKSIRAMWLAGSVVHWRIQCSGGGESGGLWTCGTREGCWSHDDSQQKGMQLFSRVIWCDDDIVEIQQMGYFKCPNYFIFYKMLYLRQLFKMPKYRPYRTY